MGNKFISFDSEREKETDRETETETETETDRDIQRHTETDRESGIETAAKRIPVHLERNRSNWYSDPTYTHIH